jgi:hypothetical protein
VLSSLKVSKLASLSSVLFPKSGQVQHVKEMKYMSWIFNRNQLNKNLPSSEIHTLMHCCSGYTTTIIDEVEEKSLFIFSLSHHLSFNCNGNSLHMDMHCFS